MLLKNQDGLLRVEYQASRKGPRFHAVEVPLEGIYCLRKIFNLGKQLHSSRRLTNDASIHQKGLQGTCWQPVHAKGGPVYRIVQDHDESLARTMLLGPRQPEASNGTAGLEKPAAIEGSMMVLP